MTHLPVYLLHGPIPELYRRDGNHWRTVAHITRATGMTSAAIHTAFYRLKEVGTIKTKGQGRGQISEYMFGEELWTLAKDYRRGWRYKQLEPVLEALYMQGVSPRELAKAFDLSYGGLHSWFHQTGLAEVKRLRTADLIREAKKHSLGLEAAA